MSVMNMLAWFGAGVPNRTTILLQAASGNDESPGFASARVICYGSSHSTKPAEVWGDEAGVDTFQYLLSDPDPSKLAGWWMKWDQLSGAAPTGGDPENTWIEMAVENFSLTLSVGPASDAQGAYTVSLRQGPSGPADQTAVWDLDVLAAGKGK